MTKNKAFTLIAVTFIFTAIIFYILGAWHSDKVNDQELKKFIEQDEIADQEREDYLWRIITRYILLTDQQETIIRAMRQKGYVPPRDMDIMRPSGEK